MQAITTVGLDNAKSVFQVHAIVLYCVFGSSYQRTSSHSIASHLGKQIAAAAVVPAHPSGAAAANGSVAGMTSRYHKP
jgi:hypothetical protein